METSQEPKNVDVYEAAQGARIAAEALGVPDDATVMVLVSGMPDSRRIEKQLELEAALRDGGRVVLSSKALGPARSHVGAAERSAAAEAQVEVLLVLSIDSWDGDALVVIESWDLPSSVASGRLECRLDDWSLAPSSRPAPRPEALVPASSSIDSNGARYVLGEPEGWRPRLGAGVRPRSVLRDTRKGKWIAFDEAYAFVGRPDWQATYDRRNATRVALSSLGSVLFAGGATAMAVFAWRPQEDDPGAPLDPAIFAGGMGAGLIGTGLIMAGLLLDPHPVSAEVFKAEVDRVFVERDVLSFRVHAGPSGASAGLRASF
jgi:hypothetical protein